MNPGPLLCVCYFKSCLSKSCPAQLRTGRPVRSCPCVGMCFRKTVGKSSRNTRLCIQSNGRTWLREIPKTSMSATAISNAHASPRQARTTISSWYFIVSHNISVYFDGIFKLFHCMFMHFSWYFIFHRISLYFIIVSCNLNGAGSEILAFGSSRTGQNEFRENLSLQF